MGHGDPLEARRSQPQNALGEGMSTGARRVAPEHVDKASHLGGKTPGPGVWRPGQTSPLLESDAVSGHREGQMPLPTVPRRRRASKKTGSPEPQ